MYRGCSYSREKQDNYYQTQGMQQANMAMHQATMGGLHHQNSLHSHYSQGDTPRHAPFVCRTSNDDFGQFEDIMGPVPQTEGTFNFKF